MLPYVADSAKSGLVELAEHPWRDTGLLSLERTHSSAEGNDIRLFELDLAGATDLSCCAVAAMRSARPEEEACVLGRADVADPAGWSRGRVGAVRKRLLAKWTRAGLVDARTGSRAPVLVDNYEGMCLHPSAGPGGERLLLLVNDDNGNAAQIGTQFVLLALLPTAGQRSAQGSSLELRAMCHDGRLSGRTGSALCGSGCIAAAVCASVAAVVLVIALAWWLCRARKLGSACCPLYSRRGAQLDDGGATSTQLRRNEQELHRSQAGSAAVPAVERDTEMQSALDVDNKPSKY